MTGSLDGKVALVTGAGSGLGRGSALSLAAAGAAVVCNDIAAPGIDETVATITAGGGKAIAAIGDVSRSADVKTMVDKAVDRFGGLDIVHANAGAERYEALETMSDPDMDLLLAVDLKGVLLCFREAIPALRQRGGGTLVATSSVQATHSLPGCVVYAAAKAGVIAAVRTLSLEVGKDNIRVVSVSPGTIDTPMLTRDLADMNVDEADGFMQRVRDANALGRVGTPAEIGDVIVWLAGPSASYITGTDIVVDGGFTAVKRF